MKQKKRMRHVKRRLMAGLFCISLLFADLIPVIPVWAQEIVAAEQSQSSSDSELDGTTPKAWRTEKEQLEKEMPALRNERARACHDLAFAEVISYNKANLERVEQNENRKQNRQRGRIKQKEEEL